MQYDQYCEGGNFPRQTTPDHLVSYVTPSQYGESWGRVENYGLKATRPEITGGNGAPRNCRRCSALLGGHAMSFTRHPFSTQALGRSCSRARGSNPWRPFPGCIHSTIPCSRSRAIPTPPAHAILPDRFLPLVHRELVAMSLRPSHADGFLH